MEPKNSIRPVLVAGLSGIVMSHAIVTDAAQLLYLPASELGTARYVIANDGERIPLIEITAYTSGSPALSIAEAIDHYRARQG